MKEIDKEMALELSNLISEKCLSFMQEKFTSPVKMSIPTNIIVSAYMTSLVNDLRAVTGKNPQMEEFIKDFHEKCLSFWGKSSL